MQSRRGYDPRHIMVYAIALTIVSLAAIGVMARRAAKQRRHRLDKVQITPNPSAKDRLVLIILRTTPATLDGKLIEAAASRAWEKKFGKNALRAPFLERGVPGIMCVLQAYGNAFMVLAGERKDRKLLPPERCFPDDAKSLWQRYTHDLSVSLVHDFEKDETRLGMYLGRLTASLCTKGAVAIYHPPTRRLWKLDQKLVEQLARKPATLFT